MAEDSKGGLGNLFGKAKELLTDDNIETVAEKAKSIAPDSVEKHIDTLAEKAKGLND